MHNVISAAPACPHFVTPSLQQRRMGCSSSSQTSAVDTTRPNAKPEESNGASTTGVINENGKIAEDTETLPDQTPAAAAAAAATSGDVTSASPPAGEESQPSADSTPAEKPAEAAETPETAASSSEAAAPEQEATANDSEPKAEEAPVPSQ